MKSKIYEFLKEVTTDSLHDLMASETQEILDIEMDDEDFENVYDTVLEQFIEDIEQLKFKKEH